MAIVTLIINGIEVKGRRGKLLWAALGNGFYVPNLYAIRRADPPLASYRLCFVELDFVFRRY
jgi:formate dehydrogenase major subunit/NADH-quinone oxidoreductase subunit G